MWPTWLVPRSMPRRILDSTAASTSPVSGYMRTSSVYGVRRWGVGVDRDLMQGAQRAYYLAMVARLQGRAGRMWIPSFDHVQRGAFSAPELLTNNDFSNGTTGWAANGVTLAVTNRVMRMKQANTGGNPSFVQTPDPSVTQYAAYAARAMIQKIAAAGALTAGPFINNSLFAGTIASYVSQGLATLSFVTIGSGATNGFYLLMPQQTGFLLGEYVDVPWVSMARCLLVDNSANAFLQSNTIDNASWTKTRCSVTANLAVGPDGITNGDKVQDDASVSTDHYIQQSISRTSTVEDWVVEGYFQRFVGTRDVQLIIASDTTPTNYCACSFTLTAGGGGTAGTATAAGTATNPRAFIKYMGSNIYYCAVIGRLPATTTAMIRASMLSAGSVNYTGDSSSAIAVNDFGGAPSSVPLRIARTTTTAVLASANPQTGSALYVKGGRTPSEGALAGAIAAGDLVEVVLPTFSQLVRATADCDLDAAGLGYFQFEPALRRAPADGAAIILNNPMGRFMLADAAAEWSNDVPMLSAASHSFVEAVQ